jgi:hypothetical protein
VELTTAWNRLDAPRWVGRLLVTQTLLLGWLTVVLVMGALLSAPWAVGLLAAATALQGAVTSAWYAERAWAWWVVCGTEVLGLLLQLAAAGERSLLATAVGLLLSLGSLALLLHPATRVRLGSPAAGRGAGPG